MTDPSCRDIASGADRNLDITCIWIGGIIIIISFIQVFSELIQIPTILIYTPESSIAWICALAITFSYMH